jgi:hypothetical protein
MFRDVLMHLKSAEAMPYGKLTAVANDARTHPEGEARSQ